MERQAAGLALNTINLGGEAGAVPRALEKAPPALLPVAIPLDVPWHYGRAGDTSHGNLSSHPAVVTLYPYTRQKDNELSFSKGTVICITRRYSDGWCEGVSSDGTGFFPGNYVEPSC